MKKKLLLPVLCFCVFFIGFSIVGENATIGTSKGSSNALVNSLVQTSKLLELKINSPMTLGEYTADKNDHNSLIESANSEIIFIPNKGQIVDTEGKLRPDILYKASLNGVDLYLTNKGMSFVFYSYESKPENFAAGKRKMDKDPHPFRDDPMENKIVKMYRMDLDIVGMNANTKTLNDEQTEEYFNYYYAHCPEGITNVYGYKKVVYENVYNNIDLVYYSNIKGLKYDFIVKPGGDVSDIKLKYRNADGVHITKEGKIKAHLERGEVETDVLLTYQSDGKLIESNYKQETDGTINIDIGKYDNTKELIIDPYLGATYYGGIGDEEGYSITTDGSNNILITGYTGSTNFPLMDPGGGSYFQGTYAGFYDVFIMKFNSSGARQWATYYGGSSSDFGYSIATDSNDNILITGETSSGFFPLQNPGGGTYYQGTIGGSIDAFIIKFNSSGVRQWATFYGGIQIDYGSSITTDSNNNVLVTGETLSPNLPLQDPGVGAYYQNTISGTTEAFILKFNSTGQRMWATFYGGNGIDRGNSITTNENNNILITGWSSSSNFPLHNPGGGTYFQPANWGEYDAFILKFNSLGLLQWATYYGGNDYDYGYSIAVDGNNNILITGRTQSANLSLQNPGGFAFYQGLIGGDYDAFILKFDSIGIRQWATFYGGSDYEVGDFINTDGNNNILITGRTESLNFPLRDPGGGAYYQNTLAGGYDAFILRFNTNNVRQWATYYGGSSNEDGNSITADNDRNILVTGRTKSVDFPVHDYGGSTYHQGAFGGTSDAFIIGFRPTGSYGIHILSTSVPSDFALYQNYPNPFNPKTNIRFDLSKSSHAKLIVYDILGKEVAILVNEKLGAGSYEVDWPAPTGDGSDFTSGVYFYKLITDKYVDVKKMLLLK